MEGDPHESEDIRLNGKYVWETAKRVCNFINAREGLIGIKSFGEYREVMRKVVKVIKEANNVEKKRRQTARKEMREEVKNENSTGKSIDRRDQAWRSEKRGDRKTT